MSARVDREAVAAWVRVTTADQGVPEKVTDLAVLGQVAALLRTSGAGARAHGASAPSTGARAGASHAPVGVHPVGV